MARGSVPNKGEANRIAITYRPIAELTLDSNNPRSHSPRQVRQIARSIETFGFNVPMLIDGAGKVIAGHGRVLACKQLGWNEVPTIRLDHLTETPARAFMIADNRLSENSIWDDQLLAQQLQALAVSTSTPVSRLPDSRLAKSTSALSSSLHPLRMLRPTVDPNPATGRPSLSLATSGYSTITEC